MISWTDSTRAERIGRSVALLLSTLDGQPEARKMYGNPPALAEAHAGLLWSLRHRLNRNHNRDDTAWKSEHLEIAVNTAIDEMQNGDNVAYDMTADPLPEDGKWLNLGILVLAWAWWGAGTQPRDFFLSEDGAARVLEWLDRVA